MVELLMNWLADAISVLLEVAIGWLSPITGFKFDMFNKTFPFALTAYEIFQSVALVLVLIIAGAHLLPWLFPSDQQSKTSPIRLAFCVVLSVAFIFYGNYILEGIMAIANYPFQALNNTTAGGFDWNIGNNIDFGAVTTVLADTFATASILLYVIAMLLIGIAFVKLMIEAIERYCIMMMLIYASPLAASTLASPTTSGIYKKYFLMFISQCILVVLNMWILKMVISMFTSLNVLSGPERIIGLLMAYAVLRIGGRMDSYLNQLGLNAAITGAGLAGELLGAGMALAAVNSSRKGSGNPLGSNASGGKGAMGGILGAASKAGNFIGQYSPLSAVGRTAMNYAGAGLKTVGQGMVAGAKQMMQATSPGTSGWRNAYDRAKQMMNDPGGTVRTGLSAFGEGAKQGMKNNKSANLHAAKMTTASQTAWARGIMKDSVKNISGKMTGNDTGMITPAERADVANYPTVAEGIYESITNGDIHDGVDFLCAEVDAADTCFRVFFFMDKPEGEDAGDFLAFQQLHNIKLASDTSG